MARTGSKRRRAPARRRPTKRLLAAAGVAGVVVVAVAFIVAGLDAASVILGVGLGAAAVAALALAVDDRSRRDRRRARTLRRRLARLERSSRALHVRTRKAIDRAERRGFAQVEAMGWLRASLGLEHPLPATRGFAAAPDLLVELVRTLDRTRPQVVVELGSGVSTVVLAARLKALGSGRVIAVEHDPDYARQTRDELAFQGLADVATVIEAPLGPIRVGEADRIWYQVPPGVLPSGIGLLLVDGPPAATGPLARYPALPLLRDRLAPGAVVLVDDAVRADEQEMVARWQAETPGLDVERLPFDSGAFRLTLGGPPARSA